jgi:hypothetical protein
MGIYKYGITPSSIKAERREALGPHKVKAANKLLHLERAAQRRDRIRKQNIYLEAIGLPVTGGNK